MSHLTVSEGSLFGLANLPYGVFSVGDGPRRIATRVGDSVVDLARLLGTDGDDAVFAGETLNAFMAQGYERWVSVRERIAEAVTGEVPDQAVHALSQVRMHLPIEVADYVDFYASEHHAANLGRLFRPDNPDPLMPNWKHLPVGYHGRASSIVVSGTDVVRPSGQRVVSTSSTTATGSTTATSATTGGRPAPIIGPSTRLDIEAELGFIVGTGSEMGARIPVEEAERHLFGCVLFNDWSARDIQAWEYVPLGPNLGKSFASTISPWVVPLLALQEAKVATPPQDPPVLPYLALDRPWGLDIDLEVEWNGDVVTRPPYAAMYWSPAQMLAHLTVNGAPTRTGDLFASGTVSGPEKGQRGAFIELTWGGAEPVTVAGEERTFLEDGDVVTLRATAPGGGGERIGFGECTGRIVAAR